MRRLLRLSFLSSCLSSIAITALCKRPHLYCLRNERENQKQAQEYEFARQTWNGHKIRDEESCRHNKLSCQGNLALSKTSAGVTATCVPRLEAPKNKANEKG